MLPPRQRPIAMGRAFLSAAALAVALLPLGPGAAVASQRPDAEATERASRHAPMAKRDGRRSTRRCPRLRGGARPPRSRGRSGRRRAFPLFGPGRHWIDEVTSGTVTFGAKASVELDFDFDGATDMTVAVKGRTTVFRSRARQGDPLGDPGHCNHLRLEIVSARLAAAESPLGPLRLAFGDGVGNHRPDGPLFSAGVSDEIRGSPALAFDYFEIFFEVEALGLRLHNERPLVMTAVIDRLPPIGSPFRSAEAPVPLVTDAGAPTVQVVGAFYRPVLRKKVPRRASAG